MSPGDMPGDPPGVLADGPPACAAHQVAPVSPFRSPKRITITLPYGAYQRLLERSQREGRSLSNLAAFLLESAVGERGHDHG